MAGEFSWLKKSKRNGLKKETVVTFFLPCALEESQGQVRNLNLFSLKCSCLGRDRCRNKNWVLESEWPERMRWSIASLTQWTRIWANSGRQWRAEEPGGQPSTGSQGVEHGLVTEQRTTIWVQVWSLPKSTHDPGAIYLTSSGFRY